MVVQHNLIAMNSNRMLGITQSVQSKSSEKLSSGYKINRAADDAAGLSISEKMRKQIKGLDRAATNAQDGVSAVQTAEGALTEVHSMLQRMNELAVQAANGTNSEEDRQAIQDEISQLTTEIDRVAETTKFNETYLLKGAEGTKTITMNAHDAGLAGELVNNGNGTATFTMSPFKKDDKVTIGGKEYTIGDADDLDNAVITTNKACELAAAELLKANQIGDTKGTVEVTSEMVLTQPDGSEVDSTFVGKFGVMTGANVPATLELDLTNWGTGDQLKIGSTTITGTDNQDAVAVASALESDSGFSAYTVGRVGKKIYITQNTPTAGAIEIDIFTLGGVDKKSDTSVVTSTPGTVETFDAFDSEAEMLAALKANNKTIYKENGGNAGDAAINGVDYNYEPGSTFSITLGSAEVANTLSFNLQVGADADMTNKIGVKIESMSTANLGIKNLNVEDATGYAATYAIDAIADAVSKVSAQRSSLGAVQNRLEHTIANLDNVVENTTAAESRIRDTDMAEEMIEFSKNNILTQAGQSMLAQANQTSQGVLSLLR